MPWSQAGDYVLFQAQKDLVCVSSGCPDDIDTANDWNPTDIYVRVYSEKNRFSKSIGYRKNVIFPLFSNLIVYVFTMFL